MIKKLDVLNIWGKKKIELKGKNISFKYSSNDKYILKDIDFSIDNSKMGLLVIVVAVNLHYVKFYLVILTISRVKLH